MAKFVLDLNDNNSKKSVINCKYYPEKIKIDLGSFTVDDYWKKYTPYVAIQSIVNTKLAGIIRFDLEYGDIIIESQIEEDGLICEKSADYSFEILDQDGNLLCERKNQRIPLISDGSSNAIIVKNFDKFLAIIHT